MLLVHFEILFLFLWSSLSGLSGKKEKRVVCFYSGWSTNRPGSARFSPSDIDPQLCTHLVYTYVNLDPDDRLVPFSTFLDKQNGGITKLSSLKFSNINLKTMIAVGKGVEQKLSAIAADKEKRVKFAKNVLSFLKVNHFNGINLSWQHPGSDSGRKDDKINYVLLLQALREEFERVNNGSASTAYLISIDVPHSIKVLNDGFDLRSLSKYLDFINVFTFNYRYPVEAEMSHHAPLYSIAGKSSNGYETRLNIDFTTNYLLNMGVQRNKLVVGIPTYGRTMTLYEPNKSYHHSDEDGLGVDEENIGKAEGTLPYYEICKIMKADSWTIENPVPKAAGPFAQRGNYLIGYDDPESVKLKAQYAVKENLGGIMFWTIDNDDFKGECHGRKFPLISAGKEALLASSSDSTSGFKFRSETEKPLYSFVVSSKANRKPLENLVRSAQNERRIFTRTADHFDFPDLDQKFDEQASTESIRLETAPSHKAFTVDEQMILQQLASLVRRLGGISILEKLLLNIPRNLDSDNIADFTSNLLRNYPRENYGPAVTEMTVTSPPLALRRAPFPIILSNFTINIDELRIDASSLGAA